MRSLTTWLLGGALAASLTWNWKLARGQDSGASCAPGASCAGAASCTPGARCDLSAAGAGLDPELRGRLEELCATSCGESDRLERRANELQGQLLASLSAADVDEAATARLVDEVSELRRRSLASCVAGILGVREVLSPEQVKALLARCEHGANER